MEELNCGSCGAHLGWINDCGPRGEAECDDCYEWGEDNDKEDSPVAHMSPKEHRWEMIFGPVDDEPSDEVAQLIKQGR